jgi:FG-GAP repeat protein
MDRRRVVAAAAGLGAAFAPLAVAPGAGASIASAPVLHVRGDFDGDGVADLAVGAPTAGQVRVVYSHLRKNASHVVRLALGQTDTGFGTALATGDLNGDGYADLAVGAPRDRVPDPQTEVRQVGAVLVYLGSATGLNATSTPLTGWGGDEPARLGDVIASGDVDGDGIDDLVTVMEVGDLAYVEYYRGTPDGFDTRPTQEFGTSVATSMALGDVNGDGFLDLVTSAPQDYVDGCVQGQVVVYDGTAQHTFDTTPTLLTGTQVGYEDLGLGLVLGDVDHDGYDDAVVGAGSWYGDPEGPGSVVWLRGGPDGLDPSPRAEVIEKDLSSHWRTDDGFGASLALTDAGLVIGTPRARVAGHRWAGAVYAVPYGADWVDASRARRITQATPGVPGAVTGDARFGFSLFAARLGAAHDKVAVGVPQLANAAPGGAVLIPVVEARLRPGRASGTFADRRGTGLGWSLG